MAETLRELVVALSLDSSNFSRNMRTINQQIKEAEPTFRLAGAGVENYEKTIAGTEANLRDNMSTLELVLNMLAEATTTEISKQKKPESFEESRMVAIEGGEAAGEARLAVEKRTGKPVITNKSAAQLQDLVTGLIETINDKSDDQEGE